MKKLHDKSRHNRSALAKSGICACFYCLNEYPFTQITEWIEGGKTARCPVCGIDAVIGFDGPAVDQGLLRQMHERWFETSTRLTQEEWQKALEKDAWPTRSA
ncbi:MAG TPA: hypothetical protein VM782_14155 [Stellaceae bacterium]|nr:hypothetical protein [Stellaceae bacterium]